MFRFLFYVLKQLILIPVYLVFTAFMNSLRLVRLVLFLVTKPMDDRLPGVRLDFRNQALLIGSACLLAQLFLTVGNLSIPAKEEFSELAVQAGYSECTLVAFLYLYWFVALELHFMFVCWQLSLALASWPIVSR